MTSHRRPRRGSSERSRRRRPRASPRADGRRSRDARPSRTHPFAGFARGVGIRRPALWRGRWVPRMSRKRPPKVDFSDGAVCQGNQSEHALCLHCPCCACERKNQTKRRLFATIDARLPVSPAPHTAAMHASRRLARFARGASRWADASARGGARRARGFSTLPPHVVRVIAPSENISTSRTRALALLVRALHSSLCTRPRWASASNTKRSFCR